MKLEVSSYIETKSNFKYQFCSTNQEVLNCINASIRSTLIVSGPEGLDFIHKLYQGLEPNPHIVNIIVYGTNK